MKTISEQETAQEIINGSNYVGKDWNKLFMPAISEQEQADSGITITDIQEQADRNITRILKQLKGDSNIK